jgi:hypothetical protein
LNNICDIKNAIKNENIDLNGFKSSYMICNNISTKCKNCEEGRYKRIKLDNKNFVICYDNISDNFINFGVHIDLKLILNGDKIDIKAIPYNMKIDKEEICIKDFLKNILFKNNLNKTEHKTEIDSKKIYVLSKLLINKCCFNCLNENCILKEKHGIEYPKEFTSFIKNPFSITEIKKAIEMENIDINDKIPNYMICKNINKVCNNCQEGRYKRINLNNKNFVMCFDTINDNNINFGLHIDLKLILKNNTVEIIPVPYNMKIDTEEKSIKDCIVIFDINKDTEKKDINLDINKSEKKNINLDINKYKKKNINLDINKPDKIDTKSDINKPDKIDTKSDINKPDKIDTKSDINKPDKIDINLDINKSVSIFDNEDDFPSLSNNSTPKKNSSPKSIDYSFINKSLNNEIKIKEKIDKEKKELFEKQMLEYEAKNKLCPIEIEYNNKIIQYETKIRLLEDDIKKNHIKYKLGINNIDVYNEIFNKNNNILNTTIFDHIYTSYYEQYNLNPILLSDSELNNNIKKSHISELELKIKKLEDSIKRDDIIYKNYMKNKDILDECYINKKIINNSVFDAIYSTNFEDYYFLIKPLVSLFYYKCILNKIFYFKY